MKTGKCQLRLSERCGDKSVGWEVAGWEDSYAAGSLASVTFSDVRESPIRFAPCGVIHLDSWSDHVDMAMTGKSRAGGVTQPADGNV